MTNDATRAEREPTPDEVVDRFVDRLIALARSRLSPKLARRIDPEDIVQSACRSFFRCVNAGRYELRQSNDIWKLLAAITVNKVRRQVERNTAARRKSSLTRFVNSLEA